MSDIKNVSLQFCCKEDWNSFASIDARSKFCSACQHRVFDFTNSTADDLVRAKEENVSLCGRFKRSQFSTAFLISLTAAAGSSSCSEPLPLELEQAPPPIEVEAPEEEYVLSGVVFIDTLEKMNLNNEVGIDSTEAFDEDKYFQEGDE